MKTVRRHAAPHAPTAPPPSHTDYADKPADYFGIARREIEPLLPPGRAERVLDVGCGSGATLAWLKQAGRCGHATGIELFPAAADLARGRVDELLVGDAEQLITADAFAAVSSFDVVLCLDVLEHLLDPWAFVTDVQRVLKPGGMLLASLPNVRHLRVLLPLLLRGRWRYEDAGILDRTHLRFFTRESALALLSPPGLQIVQWRRRMAPVVSKAGLLQLLSLGLLSDLLAVNYLVASRKD